MKDHEPGEVDSRQPTFVSLSNELIATTTSTTNGGSVKIATNKSPAQQASGGPKLGAKKSTCGQKNFADPKVRSDVQESKAKKSENFSELKTKKSESKADPFTNIRTQISGPGCFEICNNNWHCHD